MDDTLAVGTNSTSMAVRLRLTSIQVWRVREEPVSSMNRDGIANVLANSSTAPFGVWRLIVQANVEGAFLVKMMQLPSGDGAGDSMARGECMMRTFEVIQTLTNC